MNNLASILKKYITALMILLLVLLVVFVINQVYQLYIITSNINQTLGQIVLLVLTAIFGSALILPVIMYLKLPRGLKVPKQGDEEGYSRYIANLRKRLRKNKHLLNTGFQFSDKESTEAQVKAALKELDSQAEGIVKKYSSTVFITTAISQNGSLDGLFVLLNLSKMIWNIAHIYNQRPTVKELVLLYINVGGTVLMAKEINELNLIDEQLEPVITALLGETILASQTVIVSNLVVNSVLEGSANAFLSLRVGKIAMKYCSSLTEVDRKSVRKAATLEACELLGTIVKQNTSLIVKSVVKGAGKGTIKLLRKSKEKLFSFGKKKSMDI
ncbi:DUF697 domain-containing protein [Alkalicella caledoniensis]|uniref:DUF697 domain-containing protein n=1 Tax=Alkalicella caledoniensis TaxID=2731377 RepID=A0A7G9WB10_ALKCA|nr:DUF697 domain-containing protein [Alkalicella caledoniensis]QNO15872.1 DUF697 domain-containing protein [Alkalicella caledoniensis]